MVKEKEAKINFLSKIISHVEDELGVSVGVKPRKIVSGLEPDKTCYFFQLFVIAARLRKSRSSRDDSEHSEPKAGGTIEDTYPMADAKPANVTSETISHSFESKAVQDDAKALPAFPTTCNKEEDDLTPPAQTEEEAMLTLDSSIPNHVKTTAIPSRPKSGEVFDSDASRINDNIDRNTRERSTSRSTCISEEKTDEKAKNKKSGHTNKGTRDDALQNDNASLFKSNFDGRKITEAFFGSDGLWEMDTGRRESDLISARPRTARQRPPRVKQKINESLGPTSRRSVTARPFIFKDDDDINVNRPQKIEDELDVEESEGNQEGNDNER